MNRNIFGTDDNIELYTEYGSKSVLNTYNSTFNNYSMFSSSNHINTKEKISETDRIDAISVSDVAKWFLAKSSMTNKKLQKICYYAYSWFLVFFNDAESINLKGINKLFRTGFEAWIHGPVSKELYDIYKIYGWNDIPKHKQHRHFNDDVTDLFEQVWSVYGGFSADQLENLTHNEVPWKEARKGIEPDEPSNILIDDMIIFRFYSKMMTNGEK